MRKDLPYSVLKQDARAYEILLLRDQYGYTYAGIAKEYALSVARVVELYNRIKMKQINLYINHITAALGLASSSQIRGVFRDAEECYQSYAYSCAYLERMFQDILTKYRDGEPGMPASFMQSMPPFKPKMSKKSIARVIKMRDDDHMTFVSIAKELGMTRTKAKSVYDTFYHKQVTELVRALQEKAESEEKKDALWDYYFRGNTSYKKRYDMLTKGQAPVVNDPGKTV